MPRAACDPRQRVRGSASLCAGDFIHVASDWPTDTMHPIALVDAVPSLQRGSPSPPLALYERDGVPSAPIHAAASAMCQGGCTSTKEKENLCSLPTALPPAIDAKPLCIGENGEEHQRRSAGWGGAGRREQEGAGGGWGKVANPSRSLWLQVNVEERGSGRKKTAGQTSRNEGARGGGDSTRRKDGLFMARDRRLGGCHQSCPRRPLACGGGLPPRRTPASGAGDLLPQRPPARRSRHTPCLCRLPP